MAIVGGLDLLLGKLGIDIERWGPQAIVNLLPSLLLVLLAVGVPNLLHLSSGLAKSNTHSKEEMVCLLDKGSDTNHPTSLTLTHPFTFLPPGLHGPHLFFPLPLCISPPYIHADLIRCLG